MFRSAILVCAAFCGASKAQDSVVFGYVLDNPLPVLSGVLDPEFTESVGIGARWQDFDSESHLLQALIASEVSIAIGIGPDVFLDGLAQGADLVLVDIAAALREPVNCVLRRDIAESGASLYGLRVALAYGSAAEVLFDMQMLALGADPKSAIRRDQASRDAAASLGRGDADIACGNGKDLVQMREYGDVLMTPQQNFALGQRGFSAVVVTADFAASSPAAIQAFLDLQAGLDGDLAKIAAAADMGEIDAETGLADQQNLTVAAKLGQDWFGGGLADYLGDFARLRLARMQTAPDPAGLSSHLDPDFLRGVE